MQEALAQMLRNEAALLAHAEEHHRRLANLERDRDEMRMTLNEFSQVIRRLPELIHQEVERVLKAFRQIGFKQE